WTTIEIRAQWTDGALPGGRHRRHRHQRPGLQLLQVALVDRGNGRGVEISQQASTKNQARHHHDEKRGREQGCRALKSIHPRRAPWTKAESLALAFVGQDEHRHPALESRRRWCDVVDRVVDLHAKTHRSASSKARSGLRRWTARYNRLRAASTELPRT